MNTSNKAPLITAHDLSFQPYLLAETISERVKELGAVLTEKYADKKPLFVAILNGSFVFAADLLRACSMDCEVSFVKLSSYTGTGSTGKVMNIFGLNEDIKGRDIIIVEDIVDTGNTMKYFLQKLKEREPDSVTIVTLLLKTEVFNNQFEIDYVGFEIPNKFVVGYGLDYDGLARNLPDIYQLHMEE